MNHNGSTRTALRMVDAAARAGADAVKFQTFRPEEMITRHAQKARYQKRATGSGESQLDMLKRLQLRPEAHDKIMKRAKQEGIMFLSTPFDLKSIELLEKLGLEVFKIPSGEITNLPYLRKIGALGKRIIISTGMADLAETKQAVRTLVRAGTPKDRITVLHCNTEYPTPFRDANLLAMLTLKKRLKVAVGYSDHTPGIEAAIAAAALGAAVIEKHFTLDRGMPGPDHRASLEPGELALMVRSIRNVEEALGDGLKRPSPSESKNRPVARKSIVAGRDIKKGERLTAENLAVKRPGTGLSPMLWDKITGRKAVRDFGKDEMIEL